MKPIIGIAGSMIIDQGGEFPGYKRSYVNNDYIESVINSGGIPYIIPVNEQEEIIKEQVKNIDALILSGGHDVSPLNYNEEPLQKLGITFPGRDYFDMTLLRYAEEKQIPILGICRGAQIINVYHGGSLYQDLDYFLNELKSTDPIKHDQKLNPDLVTHSINIKNNSKLFEIIKENKIYVNSFHHQVIKTIPENFTISATASDGVIECIENKNYIWEIGIQSHPEILAAENKKIKNIFEVFITKAKEIKVGENE